MHCKDSPDQGKGRGYEVSVSKERTATHHRPSITGSEPPFVGRTDMYSCMKSRAMAAAPSMFTTSSRSSSNQTSADHPRSPQLSGDFAHKMVSSLRSNKPERPQLWSFSSTSCGPNLQRRHLSCHQAALDASRVWNKSRVLNPRVLTACAICNACTGCIRLSVP